MRRLLLAACAALVVGACTGSSPGSSTTSTTIIAAGSPIPQPVLPDRIPVAPDSQRVDLTVPTFSHSTDVTNPLFPVSRQGSVLFVGHVDGKPFRTEVTLLPYTRVVDWGGQQIATLVSVNDPLRVRVHDGNDGLDAALR